MENFLYKKSILRLKFYKFYFSEPLIASEPVVSFHRNSGTHYNQLPRTSTEFDEISDLDEEDQIIISQLTKKDNESKNLESSVDIQSQTK